MPRQKAAPPPRILSTYRGSCPGENFLTVSAARLTLFPTRTKVRGCRMRDTSRVAEVTTAQVLNALVVSGRRVLLPFGDSGRYDMVIEEEDGRFLRVQCKTGRLIRGALYFPTSSTVARSRTGAKTVRRGYRG